MYFLTTTKMVLVCMFLLEILPKCLYIHKSQPLKVFLVKTTFLLSKNIFLQVKILLKVFTKTVIRGKNKVSRKENGKKNYIGFHIQKMWPIMTNFEAFR